MWANRDWPARVAITGADHNCTFLFARRTDGAKTRHVFFELSGRPDPRPFDPAALKPVKADGDLGLVLRYSQLIPPAK